MLIGHPGTAIDFDLAHQAGAAHLLQECDAATARQEHEHGLRIGGPDLGDLAGIVHVTAWHVVLARALALIKLPNARDVIASGDIVLADCVNALYAFLSHEFAQRFARLLVLP